MCGGGCEGKIDILNAGSVITDSIGAQTINTNDFETTNAEIDLLYVDTIKATGVLTLPTAGQQYYTITVPAKTTASFSGVYTSDNDTDYPFYFTVDDGDVVYKQNSTEIIKDISFDRETGNTKVRVKSSTNLTYISSALDTGPITIEDGGDAYSDWAFIPQKSTGKVIRGYNDSTTDFFIPGVLHAYAITADEIHYEETVVDNLAVNSSIELPEDWNHSGTITRSVGEENQYISIQKKDGVERPTWTDPVHNPIGSLSYSNKLIDEATVASYKGISETRQTRTVSITNEASLQQLTAYHWTKNGTYWQPYEKTRITIGDHTMWIDPTESNQGIRFYDNQVIADGTWDDSPVEEANDVPINLVIFDAPSELSYPITNLGDDTVVHGDISADNFIGNLTGNADTATTLQNTRKINGTDFNGSSDITTSKWGTERTVVLQDNDGTNSTTTCVDGSTDITVCLPSTIKADLVGTATNATCFDGCTFAQAKEDILSGNAATATNATCFDGCTYAQAKADILSGKAADATHSDSSDNSTCFNGCTYAQAKADILSGKAADATHADSADNSTCFNGCTYACAKADILTGTAKNATCFNGCTYEQAKTDIRNYTPSTASYAVCASCPIVHDTEDTNATQHKITFKQSECSQCDATSLNADD